MKISLTRAVLAGFVFALTSLLMLSSANAQCATPTVAYQPVAVQPVVTSQYQGWYPGKLFDSMRLRWYGATTTAAPAYAPHYTASYAPHYTASYAPHHTASYVPHTAGYAPAPHVVAHAPTSYVTAYAPLASTTVAHPYLQTTYRPIHAPHHGYSSCATTVARPVVLSPVVTAGYPANPCNTCSTGVSHANFVQPAAAPGCTGCATSPSVPSYAAPGFAPSSPSSGVNVGPPTHQPRLSPSEPAPTRTNYQPLSPTSPPEKSRVVDPLDQVDPLPQKEAGADDTSTSLEAPRLFAPRDRTASNGPTVNVWNAVYRNTAAHAVRQTSLKQSKTQAEIDAEGWHAVARDR